MGLITHWFITLLPVASCESVQVERKKIGKMLLLEHLEVSSASVAQAITCWFTEFKITGSISAEGGSNKGEVSIAFSIVCHTFPAHVKRSPGGRNYPQSDPSERKTCHHMV